ncbi:MAG: ABC transporter permease [Chloroflexi bacterium]|nr:ABC transporter permease [Chloroflexota bacterium]
MASQSRAEALSHPASRKPRSTQQQAILAASKVWSWIFLAALVAYFSWNGTGFFTLRNSQNILVALVPIILMGLGQTFVIISGGIDLSVGWVMGLASVMSAIVIRDQVNSGTNVEIAILMGFAVGIGCGLIAGLVSGTITAKLRVPPFIVTLGVSFVARGIGFLKAEGNVVGGQPVELRNLGNESLLYFVRGDEGGLYFLKKPDVIGAQLRLLDRVFTWPVVITFIIVLIGMFVLAKTQFGRHTYAIGGNKDASSRAGVPVDRHIILLYVLSAGTSALAGVLHTARFSGGAADAGDPIMMMSIAAVVIGGVSLFGGEGRVIGTVIGAMILAVLQTGLIMINVQTFYQYIVVGIIVIMAVLMDQARDIIIGRAEE